ncbi:MAG: flagellar protein FlgN [Dehalococcoidia bacterium]|nr:flagellar protein FlgN [Dehalococcoidia bacterium]
MDEKVGLLEKLLELMLEQERALSELVSLAFSEQRAIIRSDFDAMNALSERMLGVVSQIDALEEARTELTSRLGHFQALDELVPLADSLGVNGISDAHERLLEQAAKLRTAQDDNARLILNAVKLRERWLGLLAGLSSPTYGAAGQQEVHQSRGIVSRSA